MPRNPPHNDHLRCDTCGRFHKQDYVCQGVTAWNKGKKHSPKTVEKLKLGWIKRKEKGLGSPSLGIRRPQSSGSNNWNWKGGVKLRDRHSLFDPEYREWRTEVFTRDKFKCKIEDENCNGVLQAHHILPWSKYPELRYKINNGITLCHHHHPRKGAEVVMLAPVFQRMVSNYLAN